MFRATWPWSCQVGDIWRDGNHPNAQLQNNNNNNKNNKNNKNKKNKNNNNNNNNMKYILCDVE